MFCGVLVKHYKDYLGIQGCGRGGGWVISFKVGNVFSYALYITYANFRLKISSDTSWGMSKCFCSDFYFNGSCNFFRDFPQVMSDEIFLHLIHIHNVKDIIKNIPNFEGCASPLAPPTTLQCQISEFSAIQKNASFAS